MTKQEKIKKTITFVKNILEKDASGHDWYHIERVHKLAISLSEQEGGNRFIIEMAALLHDVADEKLNESEEAGMKKVSDWLEELHVDEEESKHILHIIANMSYKGGMAAQLSQLKGKLFKMQTV